MTLYIICRSNFAYAKKGCKYMSLNIQSNQATTQVNMSFKANTKKAVLDKIAGYVENSYANGIAAETKRLEMEGRSLIDRNLPYQLDLDTLQTARKFTNLDESSMIIRNIANSFRYGNRTWQPFPDEVVNMVKEFMSKSGKKVSEKDIKHVVAGYNLEYKHIPVYFDKATQTTTVFTSKGEPQCRMKFFQNNTQNGVMNDFKVTEVYVPEKGAFVKAEDNFSIETLLK